MDFLLIANALGRTLQIVFGLLLGLLPFRIGRRRNWWFSPIAAIIACVIMMHVGGLLFTVPTALLLALAFYIFAVLREANKSWTRALHVVLGTLIILWTVVQILHLPIRFFLQQEAARIAGNVGGIGFGVAAALAFAESILRKSDDTGADPSHQTHCGQDADASRL